MDIADQRWAILQLPVAAGFTHGGAKINRLLHGFEVQ